MSIRVLVVSFAVHHSPTCPLCKLLLWKQIQVQRSGETCGSSLCWMSARNGSSTKIPFDSERSEIDKPPCHSAKRVAFKKGSLEQIMNVTLSVSWTPSRKVTVNMKDFALHTRSLFRQDCLPHAPTATNHKNWQALHIHTAQIICSRDAMIWNILTDTYTDIYITNSADNQLNNDMWRCSCNPRL